MKAFVTGANGFIGSHLVKRLRDSGWAVRGMVRAGAHRRNIAALHFEEVIGDVRDATSLDGLMRGCDVVFNLAGVVRFWAPDRRVFWDTHVKGVDHIVRAAHRQGVSRIVHVSSIMAVGGSRTDAWLDENAEWNFGFLNDPYATTKREGELRFLNLSRELGIDGVVVNPSAVLGDGDFHLTHIGRCIRDYSAGKIPVYVEGGFNVVSVYDVVNGMILAALEGKSGERYLLSHENIQYSTFFSTLDRHLGWKKRARRIPYGVAVGFAGAIDLASRFFHREPLTTLAAARISQFNLYFDNRKARQELGAVFTPFEPALEQEIAWFRKEGII